MAEGEQRLKSVRVYSTPWCGYCRRAYQLLEARRIPYEVIDIGDDDSAREWLAVTTGRSTVPQIFIGDLPIGGYVELRALDASGELLQMIEEA